MREIKFRGKDLDTDEWVYGSLYGDPSGRMFHDIKKRRHYCLIFNHDYDIEAHFNFLKDPEGFSHLKPSVGEVSPESVGQYSGKKDKDGNEAYHYDIFESLKTGDLYLLNWNEQYGEWTLDMIFGQPASLPTRMIEECKKIGNKTDNPELLLRKHDKV